MPDVSTTSVGVGLNKDYGTHILVNESTYAAAKDAGFVFRELDLIRVKGKLTKFQDKLQIQVNDAKDIEIVEAEKMRVARSHAPEF